VRLIVKFFREYVTPYIYRVLAAFLLAVVGGVSTLGWPWAAKRGVEALGKNDFRLVYWVLGCLISVTLIKGITRYFESYLMTYSGESVVRDLRNVLYSYIQKLPLSYFTRSRVGMLISRVTSDVYLLSVASTALTRDFLRELVAVIGLAAFAFSLSPLMAAIALIAYPLGYLPLRNIGRRLRRATRNRQEKLADMNSVMVETFNGIKVVKAFGMEDMEYNKFKQMNDRYFHHTMKGAKAELLASPLMEFLGILGGSVVFLYLCHAMIGGGISMDRVAGFFAALALTYGPIRKLSTVNSTVQQTNALLERVYTILENRAEVKEVPGARNIPPLQEKIEFDDVCFRYPDENEDVLRNINLEVKKYQVVAIVGASGVGKTTLVDLIPRFYDVTGGCIRMDGIDIRNATLASLRSQIGIVTQETVLFNDTVANNIRYGKLDATEEEIMMSAKAAYAHEFIEKMKHGYETIIGERGIMLSGGQRQRIAIARALLRDPAILILDEATSSLDIESEAIIQKAMENLMRNRTTLVIAHRLSTVIHADRIIVLDGGRIVQDGTHTELISADGVYRRLYNMQFKLGQGEPGAQSRYEGVKDSSAGGDLRLKS
jgi:subfamily B ATP-binding cassette protein MsbA